MSIVSPERESPAAPESQPETVAGALPETNPAAGGGEPKPPVPLTPTATAAFLGMAAAAYVVAGLFQGWQPHAIGILAAALGTGVTYAAIRLGVQWLQYLTLPLAAVMGAIVDFQEATGNGSAALPSLIVEAVRQGGISQPPLPFDPGWRFILCVVIAVVAGGVTTLALSLRRPRLGVLLAAPLVIGGLLLQPRSQQVTATLVGAALLFMGLGVAVGAEQRGEGVRLSAAFERARIARSAAMVLVLILVATGLSRASFLFPVRTYSHVIPPQKPQLPPPEPDRALLDYNSEIGPVPLRLGVLDIYDPAQQAFLLPPYDTSRWVPVKGGAVGGTPDYTTKTWTVEVKVQDLGEHLLPDVDSMRKVSDHAGAAITFDPRTQLIQLADQRLFRGYDYTMVAEYPPDAKDLTAAGVPATGFGQYLVAPPMPPDVAGLLAKAPSDAYGRLQLLRTTLLSKVVASGGGKPVDITAARVVQMLNGADASPYEITAAETLLARWAGVPARMGYGYYQGKDIGHGWYEIHPTDGATWLEVNFNGVGWVPIVGRPLRAETDSNNPNQNQHVTLLAGDKAGLVLYVPERITNAGLYFDIIRYWLFVILPWVALAVLLFAVYPGLLKLLRLLLRARWRHGKPIDVRIMLAYGQFRDVANDLNVGDPIATPLGFVAAIEADDEHSELAWLATRAIWGDLRRDFQERDALRAEELSRSVTRRLLRAQNALGLVLGLISRTSLRSPWLEDAPNPWPRRLARDPSAPPRARRRQITRALGRLMRGRRLLPRALVSLFLVALLAGCGGEAAFHGPTRLASHLVPDRIGDLQFVQQPQEAAAGIKQTGPSSLTTSGAVYLIKDGASLIGDVQVWLLKPDVQVDDPVVLSGLDSGISGPHWQRLHLLPNQMIWKKSLSNQVVYYWAPPRANAVEIVVLQRSFTVAPTLVTELAQYQQGVAPKPFVIPSTPAPSAAPSGGAYSFGSPTVSANPNNPPSTQIPPEGQAP